MLINDSNENDSRRKRNLIQNQTKGWKDLAWRLTNIQIWKQMTNSRLVTTDKESENWIWMAVGTV